MLRVAVMVSGGGTNLQAIIDGVKDGTITNTEIAAVISNNAGAYALTRAKDNGIAAYCVSPKDYATRDEFNKALLDKVNSLNVDLVVLAGFLVKIPEEMVHQYSHRIINIHPSLIPSFCGVGFYGLHVHEAALAKGVKVTGATVHYVDEGMDTHQKFFKRELWNRQNGSCSLRLSIRLLMSMITNTVLMYIYILRMSVLVLIILAIKYNEYENWRNKR